MMDMLRGTVTPKDWMAVGVILGLTALVCVLFFFFVLQDQNEKLTNLETEATQRADELRQAREIASKIDQLEEETNKIQDLVSEFEKRLPSQREIAALLTEFEAIAGQVGVDVELSPQRRTKDQRKETIPYKIVARGTFHQIANFINRLERYERYLKVSDLKIGPEEARICEATFTLSTFTFIRAGERGGDVMNKKVVAIGVLVLVLCVVLYMQIFKESDFDKQYKANLAASGQQQPGAAPAGASATSAGPATGTPGTAAPTAAPIFQQVRLDLDELLSSVREVDFDYEKEPVMRNPMSPLVGPFAPQKISVAEGEEPKTADAIAKASKAAAIARSMHLSGVVWDEVYPMAILNDEVVAVGYTFPSGVVVESIERDRVILRASDTLIPIELKER